MQNRFENKVQAITGIIRNKCDPQGEIVLTIQKIVVHMTEERKNILANPPQKPILGIFKRSSDWIQKKLNAVKLKFLPKLEFKDMDTLLNLHWKMLL